MQKLGLRAQFVLLLVVVCLSLAVVAAMTAQTLSRVKIGSEAYADIVRSKDVIADVLPPPLYLIESYLIVQQMANSGDGRTVPALVQRFGELQKEYRERHEYWLKEPLAPALRQALLETSYEPAMAFYKLAEEAFIPAAKASDRDGMRNALAKLDELYRTHRAGVDQVVKLATEYNLQAESSATTTVGNMQTVLTIAFIAVVLFCAFLLAAIGRNVLRTIGGEPAIALQRVQRIAAGDLRPADGADVAGHGVIGEIETMRRELLGLVGAINTAAAGLKGAAPDLLNASQEILQVADSQAEAASRMAAATEELTCSIAESASLAGDARTRIAGGERLAEEGAGQVKATVDEMQRVTDLVRSASGEVETLGQRSNEISSVTAVIQDIADQTNLLALNAAIEAARAGESGRGFAVVADEVRKLAERTATSTRQIASTVSAIQVDTNDVTQSIGSAVAQADSVAAAGRLAAEAIASMQRITEDVIRAMNEIAHALSEQDTASRDIAQQVERLSSQSEHVASSAAHNSQQVARLDSLAADLSAAVCRFTVA